MIFENDLKKLILKLFVNDFENVYDMHCICI